MIGRTYSERVTTWRPDGGDPEVLSHGQRAPRSAAGRLWATAAVCLGLGALAGVQIDDAVDRRNAAGEGVPPALSVGVIQENPDPVADLRFSVPIHNGGSGEVTIDSVVAEGWVIQDSRFEPVTIAPDDWAMLPLPVQVDCRTFDAAGPERLTIRSTTSGGSFEQGIATAAPSAVLIDEGARLCLERLGSVPTARDVVGTWYVEEAGTHRGTMFRLREDGTFAIDPDLSRFGPDLDALGTFSRSGATLRLRAGSGHDCRRGDRTRWRLTLLEDGRLHVRHAPEGESWCGIEGGEVWVARRVPDLTASPTAS